MDLERFADRRIVVTGAASGIGRATALRLLAEAGTVHAVDVSEGGLAETAALATAAGGPGSLTIGTVDIADEQSVAQGIGGAIRELGGLDVLVNAAGILRAAHTHECSLDLWKQVIDINLTGTFLVTRQAIPALLESDHAVIVNFSSTSAAFGHPYMSAYAASKGGIDAFTHTLAHEYGKRGIRAVAVAPGGIESNITATTPGMLPADADWSLFAKMQPLLAPNESGFAGPEAIASVIATFASDDGKWITGTALRIDGGAHA
jgi:NAD(P)-dependent dehydrogenase (short-subunit alcohol dehydrogenase family)